MLTYFTLKYKILNRKLTDFGLPPLLGYLLLLFAFLFLTERLFTVSQYASLIYCAAAIFMIVSFYKKENIDFLKINFNTKHFYYVRVIENLIVCLAFIIVLIYKQLYWETIVLFALSVIFAFFEINKSFNKIIPVPFLKEPFEFIVGFRKRFYIIVLAYLFSFISVGVTNFNLGIFALLLCFLTFMGFYNDIEDQFYVWSFHSKPKDFLIAKVKTGIKQSTILSMPMIILLSIRFYTEILIIITFLLIYYTYLVCFIIAKYSNFPKKIELPQALLLGISFLFPPILFLLIPFFYKSSLKKLTLIL